MKTQYAILFFLSISIYYSNAQTKGLNEDKGVLIGKIPAANGHFQLTKHDTLYKFTYQNAAHSTMTDLKSFHVASDQELNDLYNVILNGFNKMPEETIHIDLTSGDKLSLNYAKDVGVIKLMITHHSISEPEGHTNYLTQTHINKLFGKD